MNGVTRSRTSQARTARWAIVRRRAIFGAAVFVAASFVGLGPAQAAPTAGIPIFQGFVNQTVSGSVANFSWKVPGTHDPGATFEFLSNTSSNGSSLTGSSNGDFVYTPTPDNCGIGFVPFRVRNPDGSTADGSLEVINAPDGVDDQFVTPVNTAITADLGTNDVVGYRPSVQWFRNVYTSGPSHGTVTMAAEGSYNNSSFTYTPSAGYTGFDQFEYWVVCGNKTDAAVVTINVGNVAGTPTTTTTPPTTTTVPAGSCASSGWPTYEAECATIGGSIAVERSSTASNGAVLGGWNYGGTFTLPVTPSTAGSQTLEIRYGAPYGALWA